MPKNVFITGATRGIGREVAKQLSELNYHIFATGRDQELLSSLQDETGCKTATADLTVTDQVTAIYQQAKSSIGNIDILINNAGLNHKKDKVAEIELKDWELQYAVNLRAPYLLCREAMKDMGSRKSGHIINIISTIAKTSMPKYSTYCAMKYGLMGFTKCLIKEGREANVKVTAVYPGGTDSDFRTEERPEYLKVESAAKMIVHCITAPDDVVVHDLTYRPLIETNF